MEIKDGNNVNNFEGVVITLHIMLCMLFSENDYEYIALDNIIKIFLTITHKFERNTFLMDGKKPIWLQKPNFISLLNLPDQIKKFGNIRLFWDGNKERCIQTVKPYLKRARLDSSFLKRKLEYLYRKQTIDFMLEEYLLLNNNDNLEYIYEDKKYERYDSFKTYQSKSVIEEALLHNKALSVIIIKDMMTKMHKVFICLCTNIQSKDITLILVMFHDDYKNTLGLHSYSIQIDIEKNWEKKDNCQTMVKEIFDYGILVPCPECIIRKEINRFFCATKKWGTLLFGNQIDIEQLPKDFIANLIID